MLLKSKGKGIRLSLPKGRGQALDAQAGQELFGAPTAVWGFWSGFSVVLQMWTPTCLASCVSVFLETDHRAPWRWMLEPGLVNALTS